MAKYDIEIKSNSRAIIEAMKRQGYAALEAVGQKAERYGKDKCPVGTTESTGIKDYVSSGLKQSITHKNTGNEVFIGTNHSYAA